MPAQAAAANTDTNGKITSAYYQDRGDGTSNWQHVTRVFDGGDVTLGSKADTGSTATDTTSVSVVAILKGIGIRLASALTSLTSIITQLSVGASAVLKAEDAAHVTGDAGVQMLAVRTDTAAALAGTTGDYTPLQTDALGAARVVDAVAVKVGVLTNTSTTALAASLVVKASAGTLFGLQGYSTTAGFLLIHNTTSLPADGQVPVVSFPIEANKPFSLDSGVYGRAFATGITVVFSSTGPTKTIGGSVMWVDVQYI